MSTVQIVLRKKPNKQRKFPLAVRITKNRRTSYLFTGQYIEASDWDETRKKVRKSHPNYKTMNNLILTKLSEANDKILRAETEDEDISISIIKKKVRGEHKLDFFAVAYQHLENIKNAEKFRQYETQKGRIEKFKKFLRSDVIRFKDITVFLLKNFEGYLITKEKRKPRTVVNYMILIRKIFNLGISASIIDRKYYPFGKGKIQIRIPESQKIGLSKDEVILLENTDNITIAQREALDVWLTSFYFAGIRVSDVLKLKWKDFKDGRLNYRMDKNQKLVSLKVPEKAIIILDKYRSVNNSLVFPYLLESDFLDARTLLVRTRTVTRSLNRRLEIIARNLGIHKKLTMHIARHTFGNLSGDKIPIQMLQRLYRHSSITTTISYQANFMNDEKDDALEKVVNF